MKEGTIVLVLRFPRPWPPLADVEIFSRSQDDFQLRILVDGSGRFCFEIRSLGSIGEHWFQPVVVEGGDGAILAIRWSTLGVSLHLNGKGVLCDDESQGKAFILQTNGVPPPPDDVIVGEIDLSYAKSEAEYLFLATVMDVEQKVREGSRYSQIRAAGLLRQLFLDSTPLVHAVNRTHCCELKFETVDYRLQPPFSPESYHSELDGGHFPGAKLITIDLNDFLKAPCFMLDGVTATVRDVIRACANAKGGVHLGAARTAEEVSVMNWDSMFRLCSAEPTLRTVASVCRVALRGLKPLVKAITSSV